MAQDSTSRVIGEELIQPFTSLGAVGGMGTGQGRGQGVHGDEASQKLGQPVQDGVHQGGAAGTWSL